MNAVTSLLYPQNEWNLRELAVRDLQLKVPFINFRHKIQEPRASGNAGQSLRS